MQLFNWGALTPAELEMQRRMEELAFIEEEVRHNAAINLQLDPSSAFDSATNSSNGADSSEEGSEGTGAGKFKK